MGQTKQEKELLAKAQLLHQAIEKHPLLSGMLTDSHHHFIDELIAYGYLLNGIDKSVFRHIPDYEIVDDIL